jgi:hypothetical protein
MMRLPWMLDVIGPLATTAHLLGSSLGIIIVLTVNSLISLSTECSDTSPYNGSPSQRSGSGIKPDWNY